MGPKPDGDYLTELLGTGKSPTVAKWPAVLAPFGPETDEDVFELLAEREVRVETFTDRSLRHYRVTEWDEISWTASGLPGHHILSPSFMEEHGIDMRAVVGRIRMPSYPHQSILTVMLRANETPSSGGDVGWKLWSVIPVPTD